MPGVSYLLKGQVPVEFSDSRFICGPQLHIFSLNLEPAKSVSEWCLVFNTSLVVDCVNRYKPR